LSRDALNQATASSCSGSPTPSISTIPSQQSSQPSQGSGRALDLPRRCSPEGSIPDIGSTISSLTRSSFHSMGDTSGSEASLSYLSSPYYTAEEALSTPISSVGSMSILIIRTESVSETPDIRNSYATPIEQADTSSDYSTAMRWLSSSEYSTAPAASSTRRTPTGSATPSVSVSSHCVVKSSYPIRLAIAIAFGSSRIIRSSSFAYSSISCVFYFGGSHSNTCQAFANSGLNCINNVEISITSQEPSTESSITPTQSNHVSR
jgi:hypothetical protein